jgi:ATP-binding cassette subfamily B protein
MVLSVFSVVGPAVIYWYGGLEVMRGTLTLGQLVAFAALLTLLYRPLMSLATVYVDVQAAVAVFERIFEYLDMKPRVADAPNALALARPEGRIEFRKVSFAYPAAAKIVKPTDSDEVAEPNPPDPFALHDIDFEIAPGQRVALVGPSGAGKTTLTYLLPRFYDPDAGEVLLDGHDLRALSQESLRQHIGVVTQETFLFHASVRENLLYAKAGATQDELSAACAAANIHDFIAGLPEGYDTVVGERGFRLSGGEKQRLSIARALLKDPAILILDEATSSLDATSEFLIQEALEKLLKSRTSLIIAHRLSTILTADKIVVIDRGRVVETGRHDQLLAAGGLYAELFRRQFGKVLENGVAVD